MVSFLLLLYVKLHNLAFWQDLAKLLTIIKKCHKYSPPASGQHWVNIPLSVIKALGLCGSDFTTSRGSDVNSYFQVQPQPPHQQAYQSHPPSPGARRCPQYASWRGECVCADSQPNTSSSLLSTNLSWCLVRPKTFQVTFKSPTWVLVISMWYISPNNNNMSFENNNNNNKNSLFPFSILPYTLFVIYLFVSVVMSWLCSCIKATKGENIGG